MGENSVARIQASSGPESAAVLTKGFNKNGPARWRILGILRVRKLARWSARTGKSQLLAGGGLGRMGAGVKRCLALLSGCRVLADDSGRRVSLPALP